MIADDGWIRGPDGELYLWVPPAHRLGMLYPNNSLVIGAHSTELDFRDFRCGENWVDVKS